MKLQDESCDSAMHSLSCLFQRDSGQPSYGGEVSSFDVSKDHGTPYRLSEHKERIEEFEA
jgi:hypothetical protein